MPAQAPRPTDAQPFRLDANVSELQRRRRSRTVAFVTVLLASFVPGALVLAVPALIAGQQTGPGLNWSRVLDTAASIADVYGAGRDPMTTVGALAAITVAVIFYNARVELPLPARAGDHSELERIATVLITKSVLRFVAVVMAGASWLLIQILMIRVLAGDTDLVGLVEGVALLALVALSCNFATTQSEEIAQRNLLDVADAVRAFSPDVATQLRVRRPPMRIRVLVAAGLVVVWFVVVTVASLLDPDLTGAAEIVAQVVVASVLYLVLPGGALIGGLLAAGAVSIRWRRAGFRTVLVLTGLTLLSTIAECVVGLAVPGAEPEWTPFYAASLVLYAAWVVLLLPLVGIGRVLRARALRDHLEEQAAQAHFEPYLDTGG